MMRASVASLIAVVVVFSFVRAGVGAPRARPSVSPIAIARPPLPINARGPAPPRRQERPPRDTQTVPWWSSTFAFEGQTYPYYMVGTDPALGPATTVVRAKIIPLRLVFRSDGQVLYDPGMAADAVASPVFTPVDVGLGPLQWHELIQQISLATDPDYRVILDPEVLPAETLNVPAAQGFTVFNPATQRRVGVVEYEWSSRKIKELIGALQISPTDLAVFLVDNTIASITTADDCRNPVGCPAYAGWHDSYLTGAGRIEAPPQVNTLVWASWDDLGAALPPWLDFRVHPLSHEIAEWAADPFFSNIVPGWQGLFTSPFHNPCSILLEVADPVERLPLGIPLPGGRITAVTNAVTLSWFARQVPSQALFGLYDLTGTVTEPAGPCL
jgi:hypothetical protein